MNSYFSNFKNHIKISLIEDKKRLKWTYYKMIQIYENLEFYRLTSMNIELNLFCEFIFI